MWPSLPPLSSTNHWEIKSPPATHLFKRPEYLWSSCRDLSHTICTTCQLHAYVFALIFQKKMCIQKIKAVSCPIEVHVKRHSTWLLFSAWLFLLESGKWMWQPVSSITFLILLPPLPITWECSVCETSIFKVTRLLYVEIIYYFLMHEKGRNDP